MMFPKPTPPAIVAMIKAILYQDRRERQQAGFRYQSRGIAKRLAAHFGLSIHTVLAIKERRRNVRVRSHRYLCRGLTVDAEQLARQRPRVLRDRERHPKRAPAPEPERSGSEQPPHATTFCSVPGSTNSLSTRAW
jgi:hypothetical protein